MFRISVFLTVIGLLLLTPALAKIPAGLELRGSGEIRYLGLIKVYDAELLAPPEVGAAALLDASTSKCLKLNYDVELTVDDFVRSAEEVLNDQYDAQALDAIRPHIEQLHASYRGVEAGDSYLLCYDAATGGTTLTLNDTQLATIFSAEFAEAYFGIWLSEDKPLDAGLRNDLLSAFKR